MRILWAYAYQIVPPQPSRRLGTIRALLKDEAWAAHVGDRIWSGRIVLERRTTHILIVSDGPGQDDLINGRLRAELGRLEAKFSVTETLAVTSPAEAVEHVGTSNGNGH